MQSWNRLFGSRADERRVFEELWDKMYRHAYMIVRDDHLAQDVVQEAWIKIWRQIQTLREADRLVPWATRIVHHTAIDHVRRRQRWNEIASADVYEIEWSQEGLSSEGPEDVFFRKVNTAELADALQRLSDDHRVILLLRFYYEYKYEEMADLLQIPVGVVKSRLHRAKAALKQILEQSRPHLAVGEVTATDE
ncbi:MAG: RNA polymerase sigma factor [Alicyclobacillaceae bacterium]|nr:RNA polymerase sigma factor [Alicyclobacillaceae bacterium]